MKLTLTTTLSIASIVAAGAAAYAINVNVLESPAAANTGLTAVAATTVAPAVDSGTTRAAGGVAMASDSQEVIATPVSSSTTSYQVGTAGKVVVDTSKTTFSVASIVPASGWTSEPAVTAPDGSVKVYFVSGNSRIEFVLQMANGTVKTSVINESQPTPIAIQPIGEGAPAPAPGVGSKPSIPGSLGGDDDDDDDHEEREDRHHDDDDDDDDHDEDDD